jgi:hypothetical protein
MATPSQLSSRLVDLFGPVALASPTALYGNLMVSPAGNVLIHTTTDNGTDALQVNGSVYISGALKSATPALYDNSTNAATTAFVLANALPLRTPITGASTDLNTFTSPGIYHQSSNANAGTGSHYPAALAGMLEVYASSVMIYQRYTLYSSGIVYTRSYYNGTWYAWRQLLDTVGASTIAGVLTFSASPIFNAASTFNSGLTAKSTVLPITLINTNTSSSWSIGPDGSDSFCVYNAVGAGCFISYGGTAWAANSDERLKNIQGDLTDALASVKAIRTIRYTWKAEDDHSEARGLPNDSMVYVGVIAQDVQKVLPEAVSTGESGYLAVRYSELTPLALAAIKELSEMMEKQSAIIASLRTELDAIKAGNTRSE